MSTRPHRALLAALLLWVDAGAAQTEFAVDRFQPGAPTDAFVLTEDPVVARGTARAGATQGDAIEGDAWLLAGQLLAHYASEPLKLEALNPGEPDTVLSDRLWLYAQAQLSLAGWIQFDALVPFAPLSNGAAVRTAETDWAAPSGSSLGDVRFGGRVTVLRQRDAWPAVGLSGRLWFPTGSTQNYTGTGELRYGGAATAGGDYPDFSYRVSVGRRRQFLIDDATFQLGSDTVAQAAFAWRWEQLSVGPEIAFVLVSNELRHTADSIANVEALLGAHYELGAFTTRLGVAHEVVERPGTADFRVFAGVSLSSAVVERGERAPLPPAPPPPDVPRGEVGIHWSVEPRPVVASEEPPSESEARTEVLAEPHAECLDGSCDGDLDADGIDDRVDDCPKQFGTGALRGKMGCPLDADGDGIEDHRDTCPQQKAPGTETTERPGCPKQVRVLGTQIEISKQIQFETGSARLSEGGNEILDDVAALLHAHPEIERIAVEGHTDDVGAEVENLDLSRRRSVAVARWLIEHGIDETRIEVHGFGPRRPKVPNDTPEGREANRRVEFTISRRAGPETKRHSDGSAPSEEETP